LLCFEYKYCKVNNIHFFISTSNFKLSTTHGFRSVYLEMLTIEEEEKSVMATETAAVTNW